MKNEEFLINQALHGYKQGHELLASSLELSSSDKRKMLYLSDSSGSDFSESFDGYLEGYPLSNDNYVISRTWKASEMKRPGCVWTHSLIISQGDLGDLKNLSSLFEHFQRPNATEEFSQYKKKISIYSDDSEYINSDSDFTNLAFSYVLAPDKQIIVPVNDRVKSEEDFIGFWRLLDSEQKFSLSFCVGYFSLNQPPRESFQIVFIPKKGKRFSWDKNTAIYLDGSDKFENDVLKSISDDFKEIALYSFKEKGLNRCSIDNANRLYSLLNKETVTDWMKVAALLESDHDFAIKLFGPAEYRFKAVRNISELELLKTVISYKFLRNIDKIDSLRRIKSLSDNDTFDIFQESLSLRDDEENRDFIIKLYEMLPSLQYVQFSHAPTWFIVHLITNQIAFNVSSLWSLKGNEILSVLSQALRINKVATFDLLTQNLKVVGNKKIDHWLLLNVGEEDFEFVVNQFNIDVYSLSTNELKELIYNYPLKILALTRLDSLSEELADNLLERLFKFGKEVSLLEKLNELESLSKPKWKESFWMRIVSRYMDYDIPVMYEVFTKIYKHLVSLLPMKTFKDKNLSWADLFHFANLLKNHTPVEDLRLALLNFVISKKITVEEFLSCMISKDELKKISFLVEDFDKFKRRKFLSLMNDYSGNKENEEKSRYFLKALDD